MQAAGVNDVYPAKVLLAKFKPGRADPHRSEAASGEEAERPFYYMVVVSLDMMV